MHSPQLPWVRGRCWADNVFMPDLGQASTQIDLTFEHYRLLSGSVGGQPVRLELNVPTHHGRAAGMIAGMPVAATWVNGDNYRIHPRRAVRPHRVVRLSPRASRPPRGPEGAAAPGASLPTGCLGTTEFTIYAAIDGPLTFGDVRGP